MGKRGKAGGNPKYPDSLQIPCTEEMRCVVTDLAGGWGMKPPDFLRYMIEEYAELAAKRYPKYLARKNAEIVTTQE